MGGCSVQDCANRSENGNKLRKCPNDSKRRKIWAQYLRDNGRKEDTPKNFLICQIHFASNYDCNVAKVLTEDPTVPKDFWLKHFQLESLEEFESEAQQSLGNNESARNSMDQNRMDVDPQIDVTGSKSFQNSISSSEIQQSKTSSIEIPSQAYLETLIRRLEEVESELKRSNLSRKLWERKYYQLNRKHSKLMNGLRKYANPDQIAALWKKNPRWESKSKAKTLFFKRFGKKVVDAIRKHIFPIPSIEVINKSISGVKYRPGRILSTNLKILEQKCRDMKEQEKEFYLCFDEMSTIPGISLDRMLNEYVGCCTLPFEPEIISDQVLVFLLMGIHVRVKSIVAYHFTKKGTTKGKHLKEFLYDLIIKIEKQLNIKVKGIAFDLSALDCSMMKEMGIKFNMKNKTYYIPHPNGSDEILLLSPDATHNSKNMNQAVKNHDVKIAPSIVNQFNLSSNTASLKDVESLYEEDCKYKYKLMPKVNEIVLHTKHIQKMDPKNATKLHSLDVISALNFANTSDKLNSTSFVLSCLYLYHQIITSCVPWTIDDWEKFEADVEYLTWFADEFLPNVKMGANGNLKCKYGARMGIKSLIHLAKETFAKGFREFRPSRLLTDAIENQFSQLRSFTSKPSAAQVNQSIRIISLCPLQFDPIVGVYRWDEKDPKTFDYIKFIEKIAKEDATTEVPQDSTISIAVPSNLNWKDVLIHANEYAELICRVSLLLNCVKKKITCNSCLTWCMAEEGHSLNRLREFELLLNRMHLDSERYQAIPSMQLIHFIIQLEFIFSQLSTSIHPSQEDFIQNFYDNATGLETYTEVHCFKLLEIITDKFIKERLHQQLHSRMIYKAIKKSSGTYNGI